MAARKVLLRKAAVMHAAADGHPIEARNRSDGAGGKWFAVANPEWNWITQEYRTTQAGVRARCGDVVPDDRAGSGNFTVRMSFCYTDGPGGVPYHWRGRTLRVIVDDNDD